MPLSEKELLLLDCFMYSNIAPKCKNNTSVSTMLSWYTDSSGKVTPAMLKAKKVRLSGSLTYEQMADVMNKMKDNPAIMNLNIAATTTERTGGIRGACFVDRNTGKATVAFRGTGGSYEQWNNNFEGYGDLSQQTQRDAAAFINSLPYDNIDVTGHSNGGDAAMYVSIVCSDKIGRCVAYEGQGLSKEFMQHYAKEIAANKYKIKNICGSKDFVSPLMFVIAGEVVYVQSDSELAGGLLNHGSYGILTANEAALDANDGNFPQSSYVDQAWYCTAINQATQFLASHSDTPIFGPILEGFADVAGITVAMIISGGWKDPKMWVRACADLVASVKDCAEGIVKDCVSAIKHICKTGLTWINNKLNAGGRYAASNPHIQVDTYKLISYADRLQKVQNRVNKLDTRLDKLYKKVGWKDLWKLMQADILVGYSWRLSRCQAYLRDTARDFTNAENDLIGKLS